MGSDQALAGSPRNEVEPAKDETGQDTAERLALEAEAQRKVIGTYCVRCHNDRRLTGGLTLSDYDAASPESRAATSEKMIRKLRAGMMPPTGARRPDEGVLASLADYLEERIDSHASGRATTIHRPFQRLTRAEYARSVRNLLGVDVDVEAFLPADTISHGFDNIADAQQLSATLMEGYLRAARHVSTLAMGAPEADPREATYSVARTGSQMHHVEGAPLGTRGGLSTVHNFPAAGLYSFRILLHGTPVGQLYGATVSDELLEISIDGSPVAVLEIDPFIMESDPGGLSLTTPRVPVPAGQHRVSAAFIEHFEGPVDDLITPIDHTLADTQIGTAYGVTALPHLRDLTISGPFDVTGAGGTKSRDLVFSCRPTTEPEVEVCASEILGRLATRAYRRPVDDSDLEGLLALFDSGRSEGGFENGIRTGLQAILASPHFVFRMERVPEPPGISVKVADHQKGDQKLDDSLVSASDSYRISDLDLATRLSYFLWGSGPDDSLIERADRGELGRPEVLRAEVERMLGDVRAEALSTRFAAQWLRLQDLEKIHPDALAYPQFDATLAESMRRETELFFDSIVREDRSILDLLDADYTFVDERLAKHYGIDDVAGQQFRRVELEDPNRRGVTTHASILTLTSHANRTSPVLRGKWVLEVLLGSPPPPPPPDVPELDVVDAVDGDRALTVRERLEQHRSNPACMSCHQMIDPIGLALENFDVTGAWRTRDNGAPVDPASELYDGTPLTDPASLREALSKRVQVFTENFTENLMAYALGRRIDHRDMPTVRAITREAENENHRFSAYVLALVENPVFQTGAASADPVSVVATESHPSARQTDQPQDEPHQGEM